MKTFFRIFTYEGEWFDFPAVTNLIQFVINGRMEGGFGNDAVFVPYAEMRLVMKLQINDGQPTNVFSMPAGNA